MANSTEENHSENTVIMLLCKSISSGISLAGLLIQLFIVVVNVIDWQKGRPITGADNIITSLGISRLFLHLVNMSYVLLFSFLETNKIMRILLVFTIQSCAFSSIWLSSLLSIFFYFKISISNNVFFLWLKVIILEKVVYLVVACLALSVGFSSVFLSLNLNQYFRSSTHANISKPMRMKMTHIGVLWSAVPLLMYFITSVLLIISLGYHISKMNSHGDAMSSRDTYHRIMRFTVFSILVFALYIILILLNEYTTGLFNFLYSALVANICPALQSILLIYVATKLRNMYFKAICCGQD